MKWKHQLSELNFDRQEELAVTKVLRSEWLTMGENVSNFEAKFSKFLNSSRNSVAVSSATAGLHLILMALGIGPGDEIILPGLTFVSDANVVLQLGGTPIFADCENIKHLNVSVEDIIKKISKRTKAVIIVHFAGHPMDIKDLKSLCDRKSIMLIEDVAHAPGAEISGKMCGTLGHASFFSFFSNKNLACGEGGMVVCENQKMSDAVKHMRSHGMSAVTLDRHLGRTNSYTVDAIGLNYRMDEIRAAIGLVQLRKLMDGNLRRQKLSDAYRLNLASTNVIIPESKTTPKSISANHIFPILLPISASRSMVINKLKDKGIQTSIHYPSFSTFKAYKNFIKVGDLPVVDAICKRSLTLPLHPRMRKKDIFTISQCLKEILAEAEGEKV